MKIPFFLLVAASFAGPTPAQAPLTPKQAAALSREGKAMVVQDLKDPASAQFRGLFASTAEGGALTLCGEVNAKNGYGGYVGFRRFFAVQAGFAKTEGEDDAVFAAMWPRTCGARLTDLK